MYTYLASPYTHEDPTVRQQRYEAALDCAIWMVKLGQFPFSPIVHCHPIALKGNLESDYATWRVYTRMMIRQAGTLVVLKLAGWKESQGVQADIDVADTFAVPVGYVNYEGLNFAAADGPEF